MIAPIEAVKKQVEADKELRSTQGTYLEHFWVNADKLEEFLLLLQHAFHKKT
jgi:hypothetical protein